MNRRIVHKFPLLGTETEVISMPKSAKILSLQTQRSSPCIWALVDPDEEIDTCRSFITIGTGITLPEETDTKRLDFIGTFQLRDGIFVGHVFEVVDKQAI